LGVCFNVTNFRLLAGIEKAGIYCLMNRSMDSSNEMRWVLVTGSSMGIGLALAKRLAHRGYHLVMISLPGEGLADTAFGLQQQYGINTLALECDISSIGGCTSVYHRLASECIRPVGLVNNAGIGYVEHFERGGLDLYHKVVDLNIRSVVDMTWHFVKQLPEGQRGWVLNLGSLGGFFPLPRKSVYAASKSFIINFSRALDIELSPKGVQVSVLCPGTVNTNDRIRANNQAASWIGRQSVMEADEVAEFAVSRLLKGQRVILPGLINKFFLMLNKILPNPVENYLLHANFRRIHAKTTFGVSIGKGNHSSLKKAD
jgi:short-subunit dehydrogenase